MCQGRVALISVSFLSSASLLPFRSVKNEITAGAESICINCRPTSKQSQNQCSQCVIRRFEQTW